MKHPLRFILLIAAMMLLGFNARAGSTLTQDATGAYLISSTADWDELSANLEAYNGSTFKLTKDISATTMVGTENLPFSGTFDGQGHTLDVYLESNREYAAPFHWTVDATFKNLKVAGTINVSNHFAGGLIGWAEDVTLQGCESNVTINSSYYGDGTHGGFIAIVRGGKASFYDCVFSGTIKGENTEHCGGFCGWRDGEVEIFNCLNIGRLELASYWDTAIFSRNDVTPTNSYYLSSLAQAAYSQGTSVSADQLADGTITRALQRGSRDWTTGLVWGQQLGTDAVPMLTSDPAKGVHKVSFAVEGQLLKTIFSNSPIGSKMPKGEDFGLKNATFTCNGATFTGSTPITGDITVDVAGTAAYTLTLKNAANGSISINNNACIPGILKKVTATPASGYVVSAIKVTDAGGRVLPVTQVSNAANEYVFAFPKSSVTVTAEFTPGEAEATRFINGGLTLPSSWRSGNQTWTADTWMIWGDKYDGTDNVIVGTPPADALGHQWYEEGYALTNSDTDVLPNGNKIVWENHAASFSDGGNYDYFRETGGGGESRTGDFYIRRIFTFNTATIPTRLFLSCSYDDSPVEYYINGTLVYQDHNTESWHDDCYEVELTPEQIALIHTDGTPNVLAVHASQNWGGYHLDCGLYDPTACIYAVTGNQTVRVEPSFFAGDVVIPETVTYNGVTYTVTEIDDDATNHQPYVTSMSLPSTLTSLGTSVFEDLPQLQWVKSYIPVYQVYDRKVLVAAPMEATELNVDDDCASIWNNAFKFTEQLTTLTLPRSLTSIGEYAFVGCKALNDIYAYARPVPETAWNAFEGLDKSKVTVHVYASALDSYKEAWGEEFQYVTMPDPQPITLTIDVAEAGTLPTLIEEAAAEQGGTPYDVVGITVTGTIRDYYDLRTLASMCTGVYSLSTIDLSGATLEGNNIPNNIFNGKEKLTSIQLPETLEFIYDHAFYNCPGLTAIHIPASVKLIRSYAFDNCPNLVSVTGCEGLNHPYAKDDWYVFGVTPNIEGDVYGGTTFLSLDKDATGEYVVPAGIQVIVGGAMHGRGITSVVLPASVTDLGNDVFRGCHQLTDFYVYATTPPVCHDGSMEYDYDKSQATLHVPASAIEAYRNAEEWREFGRIVPLATYELTVDVATPGTFETALQEAMAAADITTTEAIAKLTVNGSLDTADKDALAAIAKENGSIDIRSTYTIAADGCLMAVDTLATSLEFDATLSTIHNYAFAGCAQLKDIYFTNHMMVPDMPANAFGDEDKTKVTLHVYESYLTRFQSLWGDEFQYVTMPDPDNLVLLFTGEPLYLYNVDAGLYFAAGNVYGTQASLSAEPMEVTLEEAPGGAYIIKTLGGRDELFMEGENCFVDRSGRDRDYYWEFIANGDGTYLIRMAGSNTLEYTPQRYPDRYFGRTGTSSTVLNHLVDINDANAQLHWQVVYLSDLVTTPVADADYAALCAISQTLGGDTWTKRWNTTQQVATKEAWPGVTFDDDGHVTAIILTDNHLSGDISTLNLSGLTALKSINLSNNAITGDIKPLLASLPEGCTLNVERQDLGHVGDFTLYELCRYDGLPSIAYYQAESGTFASTLIGVGGYCQFYHEGTGGDHYWDCYIHADGSTVNNFKFHWPSPVTMECYYPHHFTFTYNYAMGDVNMDDALDVLDLQATLNYSNGQQSGLFNFTAADTYGPDVDINVQDIVATVNILLALERPASAPAKAFGASAYSEPEACVAVEDGQVVLYATRPVAALDLRLAGIEPAQLRWNTDAMGFATAATAQAGGTHAIVYSMQPREMAEGRTVLATYDDSLRPHLLSAVLSDSQARPVGVGQEAPTGIGRQASDIAGHWSLADLSGISLASGTRATEADILKMAQRRGWRGVLILTMDGAKRKVVIK